MDEIITLPKEVALEVTHAREPLGLFVSEVPGIGFIAIDNSTGEAWTEEFETISEAQKWLRRITSPGGDVNLELTMNNLQLFPETVDERQQNFARVARLFIDSRGRVTDATYNKNLAKKAIEKILLDSDQQVLKGFGIYAYKVDTEPKPKFDESAFKETWPDLHKQFCVAPEPGIKIKIEVNK